MQNSYLAKGDLLMNEVDIYPNVLSPTVLNWVGGHVHHTDIVIVYHSHRGERVMKLLKKRSKPTALSDYMSEHTVFNFSTRSRNYGLTLGRLGNEVATKVGSISRSGAARVEATRPICIGI